MVNGTLRQELKQAVDQAVRVRQKPRRDVCRGCGGALLSLTLGCHTCTDRFSHWKRRAKNPPLPLHVIKEALGRARDFADAQNDSRMVNRRRLYQSGPYEPVSS